MRRNDGETVTVSKMRWWDDKKCMTFRWQDCDTVWLSNDEAVKWWKMRKALTIQLHTTLPWLELRTPHRYKEVPKATSFRPSSLCEANSFRDFLVQANTGAKLISQVLFALMVVRYNIIIPTWLRVCVSTLVSSSIIINECYYYDCGQCCCCRSRCWWWWRWLGPAESSAGADFRRRFAR